MMLPESLLMVPELERVPMLAMPPWTKLVPPVAFDNVMMPLEVLSMVPPLEMPPSVFDIVMVPLLEMVPLKLSMPPSVFDIVMVPELEMVASLRMPVPVL